MAVDDTTTVRVTRELVDMAKKEATELSRSVSAQIEHWARLGQSVENIEGLTLKDLRLLIAGQVPRTDPVITGGKQRQVVMGNQTVEGPMTFHVGRRRK